MTESAKNVRDRSAEIGINTGVLIQGILLLVVSGFGYQIGQRLEEFSAGLKNLGEKIEQANLQNAISKNDIKYLEVGVNVNSRSIQDVNKRLEQHLFKTRGGQL